MKFFVFLILFMYSLVTFADVNTNKVKKIKISVMDLKAENGIDQGVVTLLYELILTEFQNYSNLSVISKADISSMVQYETEKELAGCSDSSCMAEIGGALGVDKIVMGHVGKLGSSYVVTLKLMNIKNASVENRVSKTIPADEDKLIPVIKFLANELLKKYQKFKVKKDDDVKLFNEDKAKTQKNNKSGSKLYTWISFGTGAALLLGGTGYHFLVVNPYKNDVYSGKNNSNSNFETLNNNYKTKQMIRNTLLISGGALVITGTVLYFFEGKSDNSSKTLSLTPFVTNDSFYVTTSFSF